MDNELLPVPAHVAIILDGNGRWAKAKGMPRTYGHIQGAKRVEPITKAASELGIKYLSLYAFSTENWKRPAEEVSTLMKLLAKYMKICKKLCLEQGMRARIIGERSGLPDELLSEAADLEASTEKNTGMCLCICINYGSRDEMVRAMRDMYSDIDDKDQITAERFERYLDTSDIPDPDLLIRTSGEQRLSNFMLWQLAYTELYFTPVDWPDFTEDELKKAVDVYRHRNRRYGKV